MTIAKGLRQLTVVQPMIENEKLQKAERVIEEWGLDKCFLC